jgi:tetratricopeptide (TPR) repeat protein
MSRKTKKKAAFRPKGHLVSAPAGSGTSAGPPPFAPASHASLGFCLLLLLLLLIVFGQVHKFDFVNYDDDANVFAAPAIVAGLSGHSLVWAFTHSLVGHWAPLTALSHMFDCQFFGLQPGAHHLVNLLFHAFAATLLFFALWRMTRQFWPAAFVAAAFAIHPLRVESVAWISERKDVLSGVFFMLTLWLYARYAERPVGWPRFALVALALSLGLLCKAMLVSTPFILLLLDYWPLRRFQPAGHWRSLVLEKIPLFTLSLLSSVATIIADRKFIAPTDQLPLAARLANAAMACVVYLGKLFYPVHLAVLYPLPGHGWPVWQVVVAVLLLLALSAVVWLLRSRHPYLLVGWLWYLTMLLPVIGVIQSGKLAYADRYTYLPQIGLLVGLAWLAADWAVNRQPRRLAVGAAAIAVIGILTIIARHQAGFWRNSETLWTHALECTTDNDVAHSNLANVFVLNGRVPEAVAHYQEAIRINPDYAIARNNLAHLLFLQGRKDEALFQYSEAVRCDPESAGIRIRFGMDLFQTGRVTAATAQFQEAARLDPANVEAHICLGNVALFQGHPKDAAAEYQQALRLNPADKLAQENLQRALSNIPATQR